MIGNLGRYDRTVNIFDDTNVITIPNVGERYGVVLPSGTYSIYNNTSNNVYYGRNNWSGRNVACQAHSTATMNLDVGTGGGFFMPYEAASQGGCTIVIGNTPPDHYIPYLDWKDIPYSKLETATDVVTSLPVQLYTDGQPITSWTMKGNTTTSGTPSPQNPVTINGVGEETANLINIDNSNAVQYSSGYDNYTIDSNKNINVTGRILVGFKVKVEPSTTYTFCTTCNVHKNIKLRFREYSQEPIDYNTGYIQQAYEGDFRNEYTLTNHVTVSAETTWILIVFYAPADYAPFVLSDIMIAEGQYSTLDYEPYGKFKISIYNNGTALSPIYLSEPLRKSLDGTAFDTLDSTGLVTYNVDEYGQPQTATTETVTVPTITTTGGTVTLDVDTTIKPSEMSLTYHGWHSHEPLKRENGAWV